MQSLLLFVNPFFLGYCQAGIKEMSRSRREKEGKAQQIRKAGFTERVVS